LFAKQDYTLNKYKDLCKTIINSNYLVVTLDEYLTGNKFKDRNIIIMRHDIDHNCRYALDLARIEHEFNIKATYYFRMNKKTFITKIIDEIESLGHEIGYHYETIDRCKGDIEKAQLLFETELATFRKNYEVKTVCAHGNPLTKYDNKKIWGNLKLSDYRLLGEAFLALDFNKFAYFSDSGRTWKKNKAQKMPGKDDVVTAFDQTQAENTDDIIRIIKDGTLFNICILTHPERWSKNNIDFITRYLIDLVFSWGKSGISIYRSLKQ